MPEVKSLNTDFHFQRHWTLPTSTGVDRVALELLHCHFVRRVQWHAIQTTSLTMVDGKIANQPKCW